LSQIPVLVHHQTTLRIVGSSGETMSVELLLQIVLSIANISSHYTHFSVVHVPITTIPSSVIPVSQLLCLLDGLLGFPLYTVLLSSSFNHHNYSVLGLAWPPIISVLLLSSSFPYRIYIYIYIYM